MMLVLALVFGLLMNALLLYYELGLGAFILVLLYIAYLGYYLYKQNRLDKQWWLKVAVILLLMLPFVVRDLMVFKVLTFISLPFILTLFSIELSFEGLVTYWEDVIIVAFRPFTVLHRFIKDALNSLLKGRDGLKYVIIGLLITVPFLGVVVPLLIQADEIFKDITLTFFEGIQITGEVVSRMIFTLVVCSYVYGQAILPYVEKTSRKKMVPKATTAVVRDEQNNGEKNGRTIIINTLLICINSIYGIFVYIQIHYLFLNQGKLPEGISYAVYAREGFFQLLAVAVINVAVVVLMELLNKKEHIIQRVLEGITLVMTLIMAVSAFYRMHLYEQSYGYTRLRLLVFMFLIFLMLFIGLLISYLVSHKKILLTVIMLFGITYYIGASWFNVDGFVAKRNLERYEATGKIDNYYLLNLSDDAYKIIREFDALHPDVLNSVQLSIEDRLVTNQKRPWQEMNLATFNTR